LTISTTKDNLRIGKVKMMKFYICNPDYNFDDAGYIQSVQNGDSDTNFREAKKSLISSLDNIIAHCEEKKAAIKALRKSHFMYVGDIGPC